ncbi:MAG: TIGR02996 domain-containing protein [Deltaproteobacteria bacterium]|nr:TIGR02996 domain-containing protein [Deltaproteobacteria bacterium]
MARATKADEPEFILNAREPGLGVGILVKKDAERRTYRFVNEERSFKEAYCQLYIKEAMHVAPEIKAKLKPAKVVVGPVAPLATNAELEAQICAKPDEPGPYLVYADWLLQRQDPRGNLITVQSQLADAPRKKELLEAEKKLLDAHRAYFVPPALDEALRLPKRGTGARCEVTWNHGFFAHVRLAKNATPSAQDLDLDVVAQSVLAHPSAKFLRSVTLGPLGTKEYSYVPIIAAIAKSRHPLLDELHIGDFTPGDIELTSTRAGNVTGLFRGAPAMRRLTVKAGMVRFDGKIGHDNLRELSVTTVQLAPEHMRWLFEAKLPALETLSLVTEGLVFEDAQLVKLTEGFLWPALRHLVLRGVRGTQALVEALLDSPLTARLESIDLGVAPAALKKLVARHPQLAVRDGSERKRFQITESQVVRKSPDKESMAAARKIARADKWLALGYDQGRDRVWGEYEGRDHYYVFAQLRGARDVGCDCGSPKDPCKHALALLLLAANQHDFPEANVPEALVRNASQERPTYARDEYDW